MGESGGQRGDRVPHSSGRTSSVQILLKYGSSIQEGWVGSPVLIWSTLSLLDGIPNTLPFGANTQPDHLFEPVNPVID